MASTASKHTHTYTHSAMISFHGPNMLPTTALHPVSHYTDNHHLPPMSSCVGDFMEGLWPCFILLSQNGREIFIPARLMFNSSV